MFNREEFVKNYSKVIGQAWTDEGYMERLLKEPRTILADAGLSVPGNAAINIVRVEPTGEGSLDEQAELWATGETSGVYELFVPIKPAEFALSDEQLAAIAGGGDWCTCTCPCCCCT